VGAGILQHLEDVALERTNRLKTVLLLMFTYAMKGAAFIVLTGATAIVLTDVGWVQTLRDGLQWTDFLMARASGAPNGAHLLSFIPVCLVGVYCAWRFRKDNLLDCYQGILLVGFLVAFHELPWLLVYLIRYYVQLGLFVGSNFLEDFFFGIMCLFLVLAFWKYPFRTVSLKRFEWPFVVYWFYLVGWFVFGLPVTTINNFQIGKGPFEVTTWWADPLVNLIEIVSWMLVAGMFWVVIWKSKPSS
jgi:hypothetical protein